MIKIIQWVGVFLIISFIAPAYAEEKIVDEHNHGESVGIKLSPEAIQGYDIRTQKPTDSSIQKLPRLALVISRDKYFIYEYEDNSFKEVEIKPAQITSDFITFEDEHFEEEKEFVISGATYLRIVSLSNAEPAEGHSH